MDDWESLADPNTVATITKKEEEEVITLDKKEEEIVTQPKPKNPEKV